MIAFDEAVSRLAARALPLGSEEVAIGEAAGRVLAAPVIAEVASPPADVSAMDGYAVREADLSELPARLLVAGESFAGRGFERALEPGKCVRIFTGAPVPQAADRVVIQEIVRRDGDAACFGTAPGSGLYIRPAGSDFQVGETLLQAGVRLGPRQLVAAAAADVGQVRVHRVPGVIILATGDELAAPGSARARAGAIPESVGCGVAALASQWGAEVLGTQRLGDHLPTLEAAGAAALNRADVVVITGGASVGERDFAKAMFGQDLDLIFSKVAIKPGKPVWFGSARGRLVLGLPGNPTSAMVTARLFLAPLLAGMSGGRAEAALLWRDVSLAQPVEPPGERETFARARLDDRAARIISNQDSSAQRALAQSDLLVRLAPGSAALDAGMPVPAIDF